MSRVGKLRDAATLLAVYATSLHALAEVVVVRRTGDAQRLRAGHVRAVVTRARNGLSVARRALDDAEAELDARWPRVPT